MTNQSWLKRKIENYDIRIVLRDNLSDIRKIVKWGITVAVASLFQENNDLVAIISGELTENDVVTIISGALTKVIMDILDYLLKPEPKGKDENEDGHIK